ncbi:translational machinery component [Trematosphaeria pertusa]|uniref:Translational machinery component n=1 Tax=Trematosphaeria pertusa TaxID=390896 RepID=A0A6A6HSH2_9PLEO|nr:translational machinery component [Trematosphaeria pertusa]KAF2240473.1 translational machinery component [Trematosphaeria pertusa]
MGNPTPSRAFRSLCASCRSSAASAPLAPNRSFSSSARRLAKYKTLDTTLANVNSNFRQASMSPYGSIIPRREGEPVNLTETDWPAENRHHLHVYSHKHNTHITLTKPNRDSLISVSCGNIGFRKAGRGTYDAAYQLAAFVMSRIKDKGLLQGTDKLEPIKELELVYRGFGQGREAVTKAILGSEGKDIRPLIKKLSDSTRLKFGGTRSKKPRRLG